MVAAHEQMHGYIFNYTADGNLLRAALQLSAGATDATVRRSAESLRDGLLPMARTPHEVFATYLGIKRGEPALRTKWHDDLTKDYQGYYKQFADVVDSRYKNPGLHRLLGVNTALVVFSSPLLGRLEDDLASLLPFSEAENATERLKAALHALSEVDPGDLVGRLQSTADAVATQRRAKAWNLNGEEEWETTFGDDAVAIESAVAAEYRSWLTATSCLPTLTASERVRATKRLVAILGRGGIAAESKSEVRDNPLEYEHEAEARELLDSRILNPRARFPPMRVYDLPVLARILQTPASFVVVLHERAPGLCAWSFHRWDSEVLSTSAAAPTDHASFDTRDSVWQLLAEWQARHREGVSVPRLLAFVAAVTDLAQLRACRARMVEECPDALPAACWYWLGTREELVRGYETWPKPIRSGRARMFVPALNVDDQEPLDGARMVFFDVPQIGFVFRVLNIAAANALAAADAERLKSGQFTPFDDLGRYGIVQRATAVITHIRNCL
ncbi:MAG: hypothetical protein Q8L14_09145 [Myxococcales bacterium]|nr:hypothetical protein [Myxococcales bacterium]